MRYAAERFNERTAVSWSGGEYSFAQVKESGNRVGLGFRTMGLEKGDCVGVLAYNIPEVVQLWFGFEKYNLVRVVLHSHFDMDAHSWSLNQVEAKAIVFDTRFADKVDALRVRIYIQLSTSSQLAPTLRRGPFLSTRWLIKVQVTNRYWVSQRMPRTFFNLHQGRQGSRRPGSRRIGRGSWLLITISTISTRLDQLYLRLDQKTSTYIFMLFNGRLVFKRFIRISYAEPGP